MAEPKRAIIIGAGPAGLTAAFELASRTDIHPVVLEMSDAMGGLSQTVNYKGNRLESARRGKWKLRRPGKGKVELYDLSKDISESENLAEQRPEVVKEIVSRMDAFDAALKARQRPAGKL